MAQYVTREEYDRMAARVDALERNGGARVTVNVSGVSGDSHICELVRQGVASAMEKQRRCGFATVQRYAAQKG